MWLKQVAKEVGVALDVYLVGDNGLTDAGGSFPGAFGISPSGAVLVRPDGFVGWRAVTAADAPDTALRRALQALLCREDGERRSTNGTRVSR